MMTPEQRELDRRVAKDVMGWRHVTATGVTGHPFCWYETDQGEHVRAAKAWHPSTDIAQAWEVAEVMRADGWEWWISRAPGKPASAIFARPNGEPEDVYSAMAEAVPEAIVRAALEAKGGGE